MREICVRELVAEIQFARTADRALMPVDAYSVDAAVEMKMFNDFLDVAMGVIGRHIGEVLVDDKRFPVAPYRWPEEREKK